jgi:hypothetical protein
MDLIACIEKAGRAGGREELLARTGGLPITCADIADLEQNFGFRLLTPLESK